MNITAKEMTHALRRIVYPMLKAEGFDDWTSRSTWRRNEGRIDHVEFRSFSSYFADRFECSSASVSVWLGIKIPELSISRAKSGPKGIRPIECQMPIRAELAPSLRLPQRSPLKIWRVQTLADAEECASDIADQLKAYGLAWINRQYDPATLLRLLQDSASTEIETMPNGAYLKVDAGNIDSPHRNQVIAELARAQGDYVLASERFERARWARSMKTGEGYLYLPPDKDAELQRLAQECARLI